MRLLADNNIGTACLALFPGSQERILYSPVVRGCIILYSNYSGSTHDCAFDLVAAEPEEDE